MKKILIIMILTLSSCAEQETRSPELAETTIDKQEKSIEIPEVKSIPGIKNCICAQLWMPVCGDNGKTYSNACSAKCAGVKFIQGPCAITN